MLLPIIFSLVAPAFLIFIEKALPYPYIFEELTKAFIILKTPKVAKPINKFLLAILLGFLFALSETILWLGGSLSTNFPIFFEKLTLISCLHITTYAILIFSRKKLHWGLLGTIILHYLFNTLAYAV